MGKSEEGREEEISRWDPTLWLSLSDLVCGLGSKDFSEKHDLVQKSLNPPGPLQNQRIQMPNILPGKALVAALGDSCDPT